MQAAHPCTQMDLCPVDCQVLWPWQEEAEWRGGAGTTKGEEALKGRLLFESALCLIE